MNRSAIAAMAVLLLPVAALAQGAKQPAAIVEDASDGIGVEMMDYLVPGKVVQLGPSGKLVLGYLQSCTRETIAGGRIAIGAEKSESTDAQIKREKGECDGGRMRLTADQSAKSGVMVFRGKPNQLPEPQLTIYGFGPAVTLAGGGKVVIERLDQPGERIVLAVPEKALTRAPYVDLAKDDRALAPGGLYRASAGSASVVFKVDPLAKPGQGPLVGRLVRL